MRAASLFPFVWLGLFSCHVWALNVAKNGVKSNEDLEERVPQTRASSALLFAAPQAPLPTQSHQVPAVHLHCVGW